MMTPARAGVPLVQIVKLALPVAVVLAIPPPTEAVLRPLVAVVLVLGKKNTTNVGQQKQKTCGKNNPVVPAAPHRKQIQGDRQQKPEALVPAAPLPSALSVPVRKLLGPIPISTKTNRQRPM
jgi:hypothetical protein